jgi:hypothetical protein
MFATRPAPPPTWTETTATTETTTETHGMYSTATIPPRPPTASAEATVTIAPPPVVVPPPPVVVVQPPVVVVQPIVIDIELGVAVPGLQMRLDPRFIPIGRLRGARHISIEVSGPSGALATFQSQLAATLDHNGVRVEGWALVPTSSARVRARITIRP